MENTVVKFANVSMGTKETRLKTVPKQRYEFFHTKKSYRVIRKDALRAQLFQITIILTLWNLNQTRALTVVKMLFVEILVILVYSVFAETVLKEMGKSAQSSKAL